MGRADVERLARPKAPPIEWGKKPSPMCGHVRDETERPQDVVIVVVVGDDDADVVGVDDVCCRRRCWCWCCSCCSCC